MKVSKFIYIGCAVMVGIVGIAAALFWYLNYANGPKYENGKLVVETSQYKVLVNDIYKLNILTIEDTSSFIFVSSDDALMSFNPSLQEFVIVLKVPNHRSTVEKHFLEILGITQEQACQLDVVVGVPYEVQPEASQSFDLSFCGV